MAEQLPPDAAASLIESSNIAFVDAMTNGFHVSAAFLALAAVVAVTLIPKQMRQSQQEETPEESDIKVDQPKVLTAG